MRLLLCCYDEVNGDETCAIVQSHVTREELQTCSAVMLSIFYLNM